MDTLLSLGNFLDVLHDGALVVDGEGRIVFANRAVTAIFGYSPADLAGGPLNRLIPPRYQAAHGGQVAEFRDHGKSTPMGDRPLLHGMHRDGREVAMTISLSNLDLGGDRYSIAIVRDATPVKKELGRALAQAETDPLTGLGNRLHLARRLQDLMATGGTFTLAYLDLARFKQLNDTHGHQAGDELLRVVARRLQGHVRGGDIAVRMGGDEFVAVFVGLGAGPTADARLRTLAQRLAEPVHYGGQLLQVQAHIGSAVHPRDGSSHDELLAIADQAMYAVKRASQSGQAPR